MAKYKKLNEVRKAKTDCDLIIQIGDRSFMAHTKVLTQRLTFFRNRIVTGVKHNSILNFIHNFIACRRTIPTDVKNDQQTVFSLEPENVNPEVFEDILQFIYISQINLT